MRAVVGAVGGAIVGGALGWVLPALLLPRPEEAIALLALQALGAAGAGTAGFITGGALAARSSSRPRT